MLQPQNKVPRRTPLTAPTITVRTTTPSYKRFLLKPPLPCPSRVTHLSLISHICALVVRGLRPLLVRQMRGAGGGGALVGSLPPDLSYFINRL